VDKNSFLCQHCGKCCECMVLPVQRPMQKSVMLEWLHARGGKIVAEADSTLYVKINSPCPHLTKSGSKYLCKSYESRPQGCRIFDGSTIDWLKCAWKDTNRYVISKGFSMKRPKSGKVGSIGRLHKPAFSSDQKKRLARRHAIQAKEEQAEDIRAYGHPLD
jgi:hypothetical protein